MPPLMIMLQQTDLFYIPRPVLSAQIVRIVPSAFHFNKPQRAQDKFLSWALCGLLRLTLVRIRHFLVIMIWAAYKI